MKRKLLIVVGVALAAATVSTVVFYQLISGSISGEEARNTQEFSVVTAARPLPRGTRLSPEDLQVAKWAGEKAPEGAYATASDLAGRMVERDIQEGEPIFESGLAGPGGVSAGAIPPGMRAVSIHLAEYEGVTKLLENGDRVDILAADSDRRPGSLDTRLHTVLQGVHVLDAGKEEDPTARRAPQPIVTVLVAAKDAELLSLADQAGSIRLTLRNPLDNETEETSGARWQDVAGNMTGSRNRSRAARPAPRTISQGSPSKSQQPAGETSTGELAAVMPELHSRRSGAADRQPAAEADRVMLSITFAGLGDEALEELTSGLAERYTNAPIILSAFRPGWNVKERIQNLRAKDHVEVFADSNLLAIDQTEARFERGSGGEAAVSWERQQTPGRCADYVGMRVGFLPTVGEDGRLRMRVTSEVAVPDASKTPAAGDCKAPVVAMRQWSGEIELADGQSFWVRGLIDRPGAWDFLRRLFPQRPLEYDRNDELAILVTPKLVAAPKSGKPLSAVLPH